MLTELCHELKNWFDRDQPKFYGKFIIEDGVIISRNDGDLGIKNGQHFRIIGSVFNDGVHLNPADDLVDEEFDGAIWAMAIPQEFVLLAGEIKAWQDKYGGIDSEAMSPFQSESFGGYSYSKGGSGVSNRASSVTTWSNTFASRLNKWRKIR